MRWRLAALYDRLTKGKQHTMTTPQAEAATVIVPPGIRTMVDSAYPLKNPPATDIVLLYIGGDTPHVWTQAEIDAQPARYRWPCFVRSNPAQVSVKADAASCIGWLLHHQVPKGTSVILDLETAVDAAYVTEFNQLVHAAGWLVTKYGSKGFIWRNPQTSGGTFVAAPGPPHMETTGDTVATQWGYYADHDMSWVKDQATIPLWDAKPPPPPGPFRHVVPAGNTQTWHQLAASRGTRDADLAAVTRANLDAVHLATFEAFMALDDALHAQGSPLAAMPGGLVYWTTNK